MKVFFTFHAALVWLLLCALVSQPARAQDARGEAKLLIVEVSSADEAAGARLSELVSEPSKRVRMEAGRDPGALSPVLERSAALRAVVLDTQAGRVHVLERDARVRTRALTGQPSPYLTAFVASELLALDPGAPSELLAPEPGTAREPSAPAPATRAADRAPTHAGIARFEGQLGLDLSRAYADTWLARPKFALGLWLALPSRERLFPLLALELVGPGSTQRGADGGTLTAVRWDTVLRLGVALRAEPVRFLFYGLGRAGFTHASVSGPRGTEQRTVGLGLGAGIALECKLTRWLAVQGGFDATAMLRRTAFTVQRELLLRDHFRLLSASLSLVFHTLR